MRAYHLTEREPVEYLVKHPGFLVKTAKTRQLILKLLPPPLIGLFLSLLILSAIELSVWSCHEDLIRYISMYMECTRGARLAFST